MYSNTPKPNHGRPSKNETPSPLSYTTEVRYAFPKRPPPISLQKPIEISTKHPVSPFIGTMEDLSFEEQAKVLEGLLDGFDNEIKSAKKYFTTHKDKSPASAVSALIKGLSTKVSTKKENFKNQLHIFLDLNHMEVEANEKLRAENQQLTEKLNTQLEIEAKNKVLEEESRQQLIQHFEKNKMEIEKNKADELQRIIVMQQESDLKFKKGITQKNLDQYKMIKVKYSKAEQNLKSNSSCTQDFMRWISHRDIDSSHFPTLRGNQLNSIEETAEVLLKEEKGLFSKNKFINLLGTIAKQIRIFPNKQLDQTPEMQNLIKAFIMLGSNLENAALIRKEKNIAPSRLKLVLDELGTQLLADINFLIKSVSFHSMEGIDTLSTEDIKAKAIQAYNFYSSHTNINNKIHQIPPTLAFT
ncbi:MAG: hypothetical protein JWM09_690 [Francisellaceae bacterium]|nr:hypothetical protein [Francisellaceae bacterium]